MLVDKVKKFINSFKTIGVLEIKMLLTFLAGLDNEVEIPSNNDLDDANMDEDLDGVSNLQKTRRHDCSALSVEIDNEIVIIIHNFIHDKYCLNFPKFESIVHHSTDYARFVKKIGN
jgi:hypothetical protein